MTKAVPENAERFQENLLSWGRQNLRSYPWRDSDRTFYEVFAAEFFLTQTPADNVADVYPTFLSEYPSLGAIRESETRKLQSVIEPLGFQRMRANALSSIAEEYDSLPTSREGLLSLPRVGTYVADATLCFALKRARPILDRNVVRVYRPVFGSDFPEAEGDRRDFAEQILPDSGERARQYNLVLLDFGALVCQKRSPECGACSANEYCDYLEDTPGTE